MTKGKPPISPTIEITGRPFLRKAIMDMQPKAEKAFAKAVREALGAIDKMPDPKRQKRPRHGDKALRQYAADLKARHDRAIDALTHLAAGRGLLTDDFVWGKTNFKHCMRKLASDRLSKIAKMPLRIA